MSEYFIEDQFNDMLFSGDSRIRDSFSLLHLNIRSLQCNASKSTDLLSNVNLKFSLIGISETWLNDSSPSVDIDGYSCVHKSRENRSSFTNILSGLILQAHFRIVSLSFQSRRRQTMVRGRLAELWAETGLRELLPTRCALSTSGALVRFNSSFKACFTLASVSSHVSSFCSGMPSTLTLFRLLWIS